MSTPALLDQLQRQVHELENAVLAKRYGVGTEQLILVIGEDTDQEAIERKLGHVPADIRPKVKVQLIRLDWMKGRRVALGGDSGIQTLEGEI